MCKNKRGLTRCINQKHNEDSPIDSQKQDQSLKLESIFNLFTADSHLPKKVLLFTSMENPLKMVKHSFDFILKALFILKIFKLLS